MALPRTLPSGGAPAHQPPTRARLILLAACLGLFGVSFSMNVLAVALPSLQTSLHASAAELAWVVDAYTLALGSLLLTAGWAADRLGRRRVLLLGLAVFAAGSLLSALAPDAALLIAARVVAGIGGSALIPASLSIVVHTYTEPAARAKAIGTWAASIGAALALAPLIGGVLVTLWGGRAAFWATAALGFAALIFGRAVLPESTGTERSGADLPGQILGILLAAGVIFPIIEGARLGWHSLAEVVLIAADVALATAFVRTERRARHPLLPLRHFRDRRFSAAAGVIFLMSVAYMTYSVINPLFLQSLRGESPALAGLTMLPAAVPPLTLSATAGRLAHKLGPTPILTFGSASLTIGMLILAFCTPHTGIWLLVASYLLVGNGLAFLNAPANSVAVARIGPSNAGLSSAILTSARQLAGALGVAVSAVLLPHGASARTGKAVGLVGLHQTYFVLFLVALAATLACATAFRTAGAGRHTRPNPESKTGPRPYDGITVR
ncbi:MAG TPA: MFS transporter [Streptosporangiaceae bacterium]